MRWPTANCFRPPLAGASPFVGDPVDVVSGAAFDYETDFGLPSAAVPLSWIRHYDTRWSELQRGLGFGSRHSLDHELSFDIDGMTYIAADSTKVAFPALERDGTTALRDTLYLKRINENRYRVEHPDGFTYEFAFLKTGEPARLIYVERDEASIELQYDPGSPRLQRVLLGELGRLHIAWANGRIDRIQLIENDRDRRTTLVRYEYDSQECLASVENAYHHHLRYTYDTRKRLVKKTNRRGFSFHFSYDERGRCVESRGDDGAEAVRLEYRPLERTTIVTRHDAGLWQYLYDAGGAITHVIDPYQGMQVFALDERGRVARELDPLGNSVRVLYDARGVAVAKVDAFGNRTELPDDGVPPPPRVHWQGESPFEWEYGRSYAPPAQLPAPSTAYPKVPQIARDALRRSSPSWGGYSRLQRNLQGLPTREELEDGSNRRWSFDENANVRTVVDFDGHKTSLSYRSDDHLSQQIDALEQVTKFEFSPSEVLTAVTDPGGTRSEYVLDQKDRVVEVRRHGKLRERYAYDLADNLVAVYDSEGKPRISKAIGTGNLELARELASGETQTFAYDDRGRMTRAQGSAGKCTFAYDATGWRSVDLRDELGVEHAMLSGDARQTTVFARFVTSYLTPLDDTSTIVDPTGGTHRVYTDADGVYVRELANGACELQQFDPQGRCLAKVLFRRGKSGEEWVREFRYSGDGDLQQREDNRRGRTRYRYDALHRLIGVSPEDGEEDEYAYDVASNLAFKPGLREGFVSAQTAEAARYYETSTERVIFHGNRVHRANGEQFYYDARGHLEARGTASRITHYRRDSLDQLVAIEASELDWHARYDPLGRRTERSVNGQVWKAYWDTDRLAGEILPDGRVRVYVYTSLHAIVPMMFIDYESLLASPSSGRRYYVFANHLGAVELILDDDGAAVWEAELEPYGTAQVRVGESFYQPLRFPGHFYDVETGLHYNRFRYYDPRLGRYLESDPDGVSGGLNLYAYTTNPLREVDLRGLSSKCPNGVDCPKRKRREEEARKGVEGNEVFLQHQKDVEARKRQMTGDERKAQRTELRGERDAANHMLGETRQGGKWEGYQMERGYQAGEGFDQVWVKRDENNEITHVCIVEAKGRNLASGDAAELGNSSKGRQMSPDWVDQNAKQLKKSPNASDRELGSAINNGMRNGPPPEVHGTVVTGGWRNEGPTESTPATNTSGVYHGEG